MLLVFVALVSAAKIMKKILNLLFLLMFPILNYAEVVVEKGLDEKIDEALKPVSDFFSDVILQFIYNPRK